MNEVTITPELQEIELKAFEICQKTEDIIIRSQQEYESEGGNLKAVKTRHKEIESKRKELTKPFLDGTRKLNEFFRKPLSFLIQAEINIKKAILSYDQKLEEEERKEQKRIDDLAEKERKRLEKLAERQESKGNTEKAEETREKAVSVPVAFVPTQRPKVKGISKRDNWIFIITDPALIPREYLMPDEKKLGNVARAHKGTHQVPGVVFKNEPIIASRG
jgi:hypothetical protein